MRTIFLFLLILLISIGTSIAQNSNINDQKASVEYLIKNGLVYDGLGNPPQKTNIAIRNGKIEIIETGQEVEAKQIIDAEGLVVAPGFIDVHNHSVQKIRMWEYRLNEGFIRQGVTSVIGGPDGNFAPSTLERFFKVFDTLDIGTNVGFYVGHNGIRKEVMDDDQQREPTEMEMEQMKKLVQEGMGLGAVGLSTGLMYEPGMFSTTAEVIELAKVAAEYSGTYDSHVRDPVNDWIGSNNEVIEISRQAGLPGKMGHIKAVGLSNKGKTKEMIDLINAARAEGLEIVTDQYPYEGAGGSMTLRQDIIIPTSNLSINKQLKTDTVANLSSYLRNPQLRESVQNLSENGIKGGFSWIKAVGYDGLRIVASSDYPDLIGKYISEIAEERQQHPFDLIAELILNSEHPVSVKGGVAEEDVRAILIQPWNMIASDGNAVKEDDLNLGHPRLTGTFPRVLGHYVREEKVLTMQEAIRKMTSFPADFIGFKDRGRIQNGFAADIVVFDPERIMDNSDYINSNRFSSGVMHVFVNGVPVLLDEKMTGNGPGKYLKMQKEKR